VQHVPGRKANTPVRREAERLEVNLVGSSLWMIFDLIVGFASRSVLFKVGLVLSYHEYLG
jgi:hypothetical protein